MILIHKIYDFVLCDCPGEVLADIRPKRYLLITNLIFVVTRSPPAGRCDACPPLVGSNLVIGLCLLDRHAPRASLAMTNK